jgi:CubicO group peptidase (beta-lactamase class C family)
MVAMFTKYLTQKYGTIPTITVIDILSHDSFLVHFKGGQSRHIKLTLEVVCVKETVVGK